MAADPPPTPPRAEDLLALMRRAESGEADRDEILATLATSTITVAIEGEDVLAARTPDGRTVALAFTDGEALRRWAGEGGVAWGALSGSDLIRHLTGLAEVELVLNASGPHAQYIEREELERLAANTAFAPPAARGVPRREVLDPSEVELLTAAAPLPPAVTSALAAALPALEGAVAVYALELRARGEGRPALGVHLAGDADPAVVAAGLQGAIAEALEPGEALELVPLRPEHVDELERGGHPPVWSRDDLGG